MPTNPSPPPAPPPLPKDLQEKHQLDVKNATQCQISKNQSAKHFSPSLQFIDKSLKNAPGALISCLQAPTLPKELEEKTSF